MPKRSRRFLIGILTVMAISPAARGDYLDPSAFASLGKLDLTSGDYTIETNGAPILRDAANNIVFVGTTYFQGGSFGETVSVFDFSSINIGAGVHIRAFGSNALALLSRSGIVLAGELDASGYAGADSSRFGGDGQGGAGGPGAGRGGHGGGFPGETGEGPGGGPGGPGGIGGVQGGGGGFGGKGGDSAFGTFGAPYGNLNDFLQGGSGGGGTGASAFEAVGAGGGGGGGAIELGAIDSIIFAGGSLIADGGGVGSAFAANAGGGSGGGLLIHASTIDVEGKSLIAARGGAYFGGGGRILFLTDTATINQTGGNLAVGEGGGANNQEPGVIEYGFLQSAVVPEPASLVLVAIGGLGAALVTRARRRVS
ncbi:PEP-CTERM sorting domain-containing protein [Tundrisphaera lichenicola]|uniref:PEP-CTERM sorting domain-containing protein n=1 Tax=Tundrisphaera lichenicola TaxID=2029860 RepID=UPI003EBEFFB8